MLELNLKAHRGNFHLQIACSLAASWTVVFGPSGAGKSTLLRLIAGLEQPGSGDITLDSQTLTDTAARLHLQPGRRQVGLVAQQSALFPHMSVHANVGYGLAKLDNQIRSKRIASVLDIVGALHLAGRSPKSLSGGEAQRVSLARALAPMPRLLLLDEPLSALDAAARDQILAQLQSWLAAQKIQTILVTHDVGDALATAAEVLALHEGTLTARGPAGTVLAAERERLLTRLQSR